mmetsp:Transcript_3291/g.6173  ORF Transcript_3291/g.6173 Transcript_3291/m.6173 type:complete len:292 (+) Transcript_3291:2063-2938(+)
MINDNVLHGNQGLVCYRICRGKNGQPAENGKQTVFLTNVVGSSAEALLTANLNATGIHEIAEKLPTGRSFEHFKPILLGYVIQGRCSRHRTSHALQALLEVGNTTLCTGSNDRNGVRRSHKESLSENHVAISVTVRGGTKVRGIGVLRWVTLVHQFRSVRQIGIRMAPTKVLQRCSAHNRIRASAQLRNENSSCVWSGDSTHAVKQEPEIRAPHKLLELVKVKHCLEKRDVVICTVNHFDFKVRSVAVGELGRSENRQIQSPKWITVVLTGYRRILIAGNTLCVGKNLIRH